MLENLDIQAFLLLNGLHTASLDPIMSWITAKNSWIPLYVLIIGWLIWQYRMKSIGMLLCIVIVITLSDQTASHLLKPLIGRLRPCHNADIQFLIHLVGDCGGEFGFASSHAANCFALATCLYLLNYKKNKFFLFFYFWAIIVSYSRIYVGVHYPLDVLAGAGIGTFYAFSFVTLYQKYLYMKKLISLTVFYFIFQCTLNAQNSNGEAINGIWWTQEKDSKVQIYKVNNQYFGKIVWARDPNDKEGKPKIDKNNPDPALKTRPIMGMVFLQKFVYTGDNVYREGEIYDPRNGKTYSCKMTFKGKELDVRGYIGSPMFGKTVTFTRVE